MDAVEEILDSSLLLDLETAPDGTILKVGAVSGGEEGFLKGRFREADAVRMLDGLCKEARFVLGHNILDHDLPLLRKRFPTLALHRLPVIDTLFLSPIAFPENPYHHLVKDYKLVRTALNDPVADARNAGLLFRDQFGVFEALKESAPALARFYAWAFAETMEPLFRAFRMRHGGATDGFRETGSGRVCAGLAAGKSLSRYPPACLRDDWGWSYIFRFPDYARSHDYPPPVERIQHPACVVWNATVFNRLRRTR